MKGCFYFKIDLLDNLFSFLFLFLLLFVHFFSFFSLIFESSWVHFVRMKCLISGCVWSISLAISKHLVFLNSELGHYMMHTCVKVGESLLALEVSLKELFLQFFSSIVDDFLQPGFALTVNHLD